jgi:cell division septal protein FtsQ
VSEITFPPTEQEGPPVDPRFRRRWVEARRAEGRRRLRIVLGVLAIVAVAGAAFGLFFSPLLRVRDVIIRGNAHTPVAQVLAAARLAPGDPATPMVDVGATRARVAVESLPWVAGASFVRRWPWTVVITVSERKPVAWVVSGQSHDVVDQSGRVLEVSPASLTAPSLPLIRGASGAAAGGQLSPQTGYSDQELGELLAAAAAVSPPLSHRGLVLQYSAPVGLVGYLGRERTLVLLGDGSALPTKMAVLEELASRVTLTGYSQVDLTVPERPALTPVPVQPG